MLLSAAACLIAPMPALAQQAASADPVASEIVVSATKRDENIRNVGLSVQAVTGAQLTALGIATPADLAAIVPGFNANPTTHSDKPTYGIRGVNFQDSALQDSPTVSIYADQAPLPFSSLAVGSFLDLQQVEVLKGPQGTLFGENATGGAINLIANKPTDTFHWGGDVTYGRFNALDAQGYVSGPVADHLSLRFALRTTQAGPWQYSYTRDAQTGAKNLTSGRLSLHWDPTSRLTIDAVVAGFIDRSQNQAGQLYGFFGTLSKADPRLVGSGALLNGPYVNQGMAGHYPFAPANDRAADWSPCINDSPSDPPYNTQTAPYGFPRPANGTACAPYRNSNWDLRGSVRVDYQVSDDVKLTSITSVIHYSEDEPMDTAGVAYQINTSITTGHVDSAYQELRLAGAVAGRGTWIVGANYEHDHTHERIFTSVGDTSTSPLLGAYPVYIAVPESNTTSNVYAAFANVDYPLSSRFSVTSGLRFTQDDIAFRGCTYDGGDGTFSNGLYALQGLEERLHGTPGTAVNAGPGGCTTLGPAPTFNSVAGGFTNALNQHNLSWTAGVKYHPAGDDLIYATASRGYKAGGYPTTGSTSYLQFLPARQEDVIAFELGNKATLFDRKLLIDVAAYYDIYHNKQIQGTRIDPVFGPVGALVNVPNSQIYGTEAAVTWQPLAGLHLVASANYVHTEIRGCTAGQDSADANTAGGPGCYNGTYHNYDPFGALGTLTGQRLPYTPEWQTVLDAQYEWPVGAARAFVGGSYTYQGDATGAFVASTDGTEPAGVMAISARTLVGLRAGIDSGHWRVEAWGKNILNAYYWTGTSKTIDVLYRLAGMPATYGLTISCHF